MKIIECHVIDPDALAHVVGGGAKDAAFCAQLRQTGMAFGNAAAGGKIADKLVPGGAPDGFHGGLASLTARGVAPLSLGIIKNKVDDALPDFCKH